MTSAGAFGLKNCWRRVSLSQLSAVPLQRVGSGGGAKYQVCGADPAHHLEVAWRLSSQAGASQPYRHQPCLPTWNRSFPSCRRC